MIIVGEKINTSRKSVAAAVEGRDAATIRRIAKEQTDAGAHYIDVNAGTYVKGEAEHLQWLIQTVQSEVDLPLCLDSPNPEVLKAVIDIHRGEPMINSISLEEDRFRDLFPIVTGRPCKVVALCMARASMPTTAEDRILVGAELIERLTEGGVPPDRIFVDPLVQPVSVDTRMGPAILEAISGIMEKFPGVNTICGLSNISFGLPARRLINRQFLSLAVRSGLSAAILDPTDRNLMAGLFATRMLLGQDEYCGEFLDAHEKGIVTVAS